VTFYVPRYKTKKQGVTLTTRNRTGPPCSVGRPTAHAPCPAAAHRPRDRPARRQRYRRRRRQTKDASEQNNTGQLDEACAIACGAVCRKRARGGAKFNEHACE